jgi:hypothetical protein
VRSNYRNPELAYGIYRPGPKRTRSGKVKSKINFHASHTLPVDSTDLRQHKRVIGTRKSPYGSRRRSSRRVAPQATGGVGLFLKPTPPGNGADMLTGTLGKRR